MAGPLDSGRLGELRGLMGPDLDGILRSLIESIAGSIGQAGSALAEGRLSDVAYAAHACRNDALMVGATRLQEPLTALESSARAEQLEPSRTALHRVRELWPETLAALERAAGRDGDAG